MKDTAILVTTFLRDELLFRCIESIRSYYPTIPIFIGDNGYPSDEKRAFSKKHHCCYLELPFDCGVGGTRNEAIKRIPTKYKYLVITEDDCVFSKGTKLETWQRVLESDSSIGIAGGQLKHNEVRIQHYEGNLEIRGDTKYIKKILNPEWHETDGIEYNLFDLVLNVFMMNLDLWRGGSKVCPDPIQWDKQFKTALEHSDFFTNLKYKLKDGIAIPRKSKWKVAYIPEVWMYHRHEGTSKTYRSYRSRPIGFSLYAKKWGIKYGMSDYNPKPNEKLDYTTYGGFVPVAQDELLATTISILEKRKIRWWLMCSSALGAFRDDNYVGDIDIGIGPNQLKFWDVLLKDFKEAGFSLYKAWKDGNKKIELTFKKNGIKIDLFFHYNHTRGTKYWYGVFGPDKAGRWGKFMQLFPRVIDARLYDKLGEIVFRGMRCWLPSPTKEYLIAEYGPKWHIPDIDWVYWRDGFSTDPEFLRANRTVYIGHIWDNFGVKHVNLIEDAKRLGKLTVGVITDEALKEEQIIPDNSFDERFSMVSAIRGIGKVVKQGHINPAGTIQKMKAHPNYLVSTDDDKEGCPGGEFVRLFNNKVVHIPYRGVVAKSKTATKSGTVAICIKTFLRDKNFIRCIEHIKDNFPYPYKLYIADDGHMSNGKEFLYVQLKDKGHEIIHLNFNVGLSAGRNAILDRVSEKTVLIMDDDILLMSGDPITKMMTVLNHDKDVGLVAGALKTEQAGEFYPGNENYARGLDLVISNKLLYRNPTGNEIRNAGKVFYRYADQVINFFLARREIFDDVRWDNRIKIEFEHMDFFLRLKETKWKSASVLDAVAIHAKQNFINREMLMEYERCRRDTRELYFYNKHGIKRVVNRWQ